MDKQKHQQNQSLIENAVLNDTTPDSVKIESQSESQPDATKPQEHGRSMTEMLGVLAIIGVLSIGGIQGYRYAMNKYHSNEVVNELNLLNAQLAIFMNSNHEDEAIMSLGDPYDTTETIKTGGYVFAYGCGQDPTSTTPCDLDETGYYMTLSGVSKDVCKSASQMTANMMNLVEQRVNNMTDYDGILCHDNNNVMTFLFDVNEGGSFDNEGENGNDNDATNPYNPDTTYSYPVDTAPVVTGPVETGPIYTEPVVTEPVATAPVVTDTENCPAGYFYSDTTNSCYSCNEHKPYTDFTDMPNAIAVNFHNGLFERCTNRYSECGTVGMFCGSFLTSCPSGYVLNKNSCRCSSQGIPVYISGLGWPSNCTFDGSERGAPSNNACCEPEGFDPTYTEPIYTEPVYTEPVATEPIYTEPVVTEPVATEPYFATTLNCDVPYCDWTGWLDSGKPDYTPTGGDVEGVKNLCKGGWVGDIQCRASMWPNTPLDQLEQVVTCNKEVGLVCRNQDQKPGGVTPPACVNYQINVNCCYKPAGCE